LLIEAEKTAVKNLGATTLWKAADSISPAFHFDLFHPAKVFIDTA
jgi:hypothetical protein